MGIAGKRGPIATVLWIDVNTSDGDSNSSNLREAKEQPIGMTSMRPVATLIGRSLAFCIRPPSKMRCYQESIRNSCRDVVSPSPSPLQYWAGLHLMQFLMGRLPYLQRRSRLTAVSAGENAGAERHWGSLARGTFELHQ